MFKTIHEITWVDLGTMAIEIERTENNALLTIDPQYADIKAIFYIKVNPTIEGIIDAARTIGGRQVDANAVKQLVDAKLDGAFRDVAASFSLMSLHAEREKFIQEVQNRLKTDLEEKGLVLESVSILTLRAARQGSFGTDDVFGAQVVRANAQVIQQALRERNDIERKTEIEIKQRDTASAKIRLDLDRELALASAAQEREVRTMQAAEKAEADQKVYEELQKSELARVSKERAVALTELERDQQLAIQNQRKDQEVAAAEQQRQITVLQEQQKPTASERELLVVAAQREEANQAIKLVEATQQAQREARIKVIEAEREAQKAMIDQKNTIELAALRKQREAEAQAKALKETASAQAEAALKQAETLRTQAQAEMAKAKADAAMREAEAVQAKGMAQAEAIRAQGLAEAESNKAKAEALGSAMASMNIKLIGDPAAAAAATLLRTVTLADGLGEVVKAAPAPVREIGQQLINKVTGNLNGDALIRENGTQSTEHRAGPNVAELAGQVTGQVTGDDRAVVEQAQHALGLLPIINELPFEELYLRATAK